MLSFIVEHIDAIISAAVGFFASYYGFRTRPGTAHPRAGKALGVCGVLLLCCGILGLLFAWPATPPWQRHVTRDGGASAEFPTAPQAKQSVDTVNGFSVERVSLLCSVPQKDICLLLSFTPIPSEDSAISDAERIGLMKEHYQQQGLSVLRESQVQCGAASGHALDFAHQGGAVRTWTRIAFAPGKMYRVVVTSTGSHHDDPLVARYLESFRIERSGKE
jgi:hypothetical protein